MKSFKKKALPGAIALALLAGAGTANANVYVQCPGDKDGDAAWNSPGEKKPGQNNGPPANTRCMHLTAGDGFMNGSDGHPMYTFGFADKTGVKPADVIAEGILAARWPGSTIELDEGDEFYLSLTNVGTVMRPDLFDPHTVHFHGFPNAATVFDGVPEVSISINMGGTLTYYYNIVEPGTFIYHCHVEATEHMEMGMLANLYVHPAQDVNGYDVDGNGTIEAAELTATQAQRKGGAAGNPMGYAYNDGDGTTGFDVEAPLQVSAFDSDFHDAHIAVQPLPFAALEGNYPQINGRGYPDTIKDPAVPNQDPLTLNMGPPVDDAEGSISGVPFEVLNNGEVSQDMGAAVSVNAGDRLLLRLSNVGIDRFYTLTIPGLTMKIVGTGAKLMRSVDGTKNLYQETASVNFGGGETHDVLVDIPADATGKTFFLHTTELHQMGNKTQLDGGMITEIAVN